MMDEKDSKVINMGRIGLRKDICLALVIAFLFNVHFVTNVQY